MLNPTQVLHKIQANGKKEEAISAPLKGVTLRGNKRGPDLPAGFAYLAKDGTKASVRVDLFPTSGVVEFQIPEGVPSPKEGTYSLRAPLGEGKDARWATVGYAVVQEGKVALAFDAIPPSGRVVISFAETIEERRARLAKEKEAKEEKAEEAEEAGEASSDEGDFPEDPFAD